MARTLTHSVNAGAKLLDEHVPGWFGKVSTDNLRLANTSLCVLGQLYGNYWTGRAQLSLLTGSTVSVVEHGFQASDDCFERNGMAGYDRLTQLWVKVINDRRESATK